MNSQRTNLRQVQVEGFSEINVVTPCLIGCWRNCLVSRDRSALMQLESAPGINGNFPGINGTFPDISGNFPGAWEVFPGAFPNFTDTSGDQNSAKHELFSLTRARGTVSCAFIDIRETSTD